ncbi:lactonase family protein [Paenibacillus ottowii]|uniref:lactonase family protein n=1 Tax=Paenibacillus ottowii TaxID=2315729 RepID=UPI001FCBF15A|nr:beta-propeller fold lactonase family protein [Paenibacillus ottowii]
MEEKKEQLFYIGALHMDNGDFRMVGGVEGVERPSFLALHPNGTKLYAASKTDQGELYTYQVNTQTGELHPLDRKGTEGAHTCYVSVTSDGRYVLASNYSGGNAVVFPVTKAGGLGDMSGQVQRFLYVSNRGHDSIVLYHVDLDSGQLKTIEWVETFGSTPRMYWRFLHRCVLNLRANYTAYGKKGPKRTMRK